MTDALKPCPFEHGANTHAPQVQMSRAWCFVVCGVCLAMGPRAATESEAIAAWNRRASGFDPVEREMLIYWLIRSYQAFGRSGWESGDNDTEASKNLLDVLANLGYDPNLSPKARELVSRMPAYYLERAKQLWQPLPEPPKEECNRPSLSDCETFKSKEPRHRYGEGLRYEPPKERE